MVALAVRAARVHAAAIEARRARASRTTASAPAPAGRSSLTLDLEVARRRSAMVRLACSRAGRGAVSTACWTHPVGGQVHAGRAARPASPSTFSSTSSPCLAHALEQRLEPAEPRLGRQLGLVLLAAQHAQQAPHLGQRVAAGLLDRRGSFCRAAAVSPAAITRGTALGLDDHGAEPVGHHGLELLGDAPRSSSTARRARSSRSASSRSALTRSSRCSSTRLRTARPASAGIEASTRT